MTRFGLFLSTGMLALAACAEDTVIEDAGGSTGTTTGMSAGTIVPTSTTSDSQSTSSAGSTTTSDSATTSDPDSGGCGDYLCLEHTICFELDAGETQCGDCEQVEACWNQVEPLGYQCSGCGGWFCSYEISRGELAEGMCCYDVTGYSNSCPTSG